MFYSSLQTRRTNFTREQHFLFSKSNRMYHLSFHRKWKLHLFSSYRKHVDLANFSVLFLCELSNFRNENRRSMFNLITKFVGQDQGHGLMNKTNAKVKWWPWPAAHFFFSRFSIKLFTFCAIFHPFNIPLRNFGSSPTGANTILHTVSRRIFAHEQTHPEN